MPETARYITSCTEDEEGNLILEFPDGLLELVGWKEGDTLDVQALADSIILRRVDSEGSGAGGESETA
jgi:bifunctional DNA-binding transcriptional regulator/antitoxin component of YhaV-PrlF toxin-antitoxin module